MTVTNFIWDELSDNVLMETNGAGTVTARYSNRPEQFGELISQERSGITRYYHYETFGEVKDSTVDTVEYWTIHPRASYRQYGTVRFWCLKPPHSKTKFHGEIDPGELEWQPAGTVPETRNTSTINLGYRMTAPPRTITRA